MVTLNLPHNNLTMTARLMYSFGLLASFPLQILPAFEISEKTQIYQILPTLPSFPRVRNLQSHSVIVQKYCVSVIDGSFDRLSVNQSA